jgi:hypothetical protein
MILIEIKYVMRQPGCLICRVYQREASHYIKHLLWENVYDLETRKRIIASLGYCPEHTRLLASTEYSKCGDAMGVNIIYENLSQAMIHRLETWRLPRQRHNGISGLFERAARWLENHEPTSTTLSTKATCRVCQIAGESAAYALSVLMEELDTQADEWLALYRAADGLCLTHLRTCLEQWSPIYPAAAEFLRQDTLQRLNRWSVDMHEYVRKRAWDKRHETITDEENLAWQRTLAFFTGYPPETFTVNGKRDEKDE